MLSSYTTTVPVAENNTCSELLRWLTEEAVLTTLPSVAAAVSQWSAGRWNAHR